MNKLYNRIDWVNNTTPALNETNLNLMSKAIDDLDDRVVLIAGNILVTVPQLQEMLEDCTELEQRLEAMTENPPYIGDNGHWYTWDTDTGAYVDSGIDASITVQIADITMLEPNATPYVTNTGTDTDPIFHLFIPRGQSGKGISSIAKTGTSGYVDTYTITYTDGTTTTYTVTNGRNTDQVSTIPAASAELVDTIYQYIGESTSSYTHGFYYECVNDGGVYKWVNIPVGNDPVEITSTDPYTYRQGKGNLADMEIVGASVGWNQHIPTKSTTTVSGITFTVDNTAHTITISGTASANANLVFYPDSVTNGFKGVTGHRYLYKVDNSGLTQDTITHKFISNNGFSNASNLTSERSYCFITCTDGTRGAGIMLRVTSGTVISTPVVVHYPNLIDLTQAFNPTVADAIYAMEQATAGAGVAFFRKYFSKDYYAYDAGSIQSVSVGSRKVVGFNQWDEEWELGAYSETTGEKISDNAHIRCKNFIPVIPNTNYCYKGPDSRKLLPRYYGKGQNFIGYPGEINPNEVFTIPDNVYYLTFQLGTAYGTTYKNDICINISDSSKNGTYEPYTSTAYPFDSTKELRGLFSLEGGELKASGDIYTADGNIQRKYGIVDLGTLTWNYSSESGHERMYAVFANWKRASSANVVANGICQKMNVVSSQNTYNHTAEGIAKSNNSDGIYVYLSNMGTDAATFKTAMSGVYLVYELTTPTTESAQSYQNPQRAYIDGTEEFTDGLTRDVMIPVGNNSTYQQDKILPSVEDYVDAVAEPKADISAIATEENGATASKAYTTGQHFYKDGKFCTAISAIAQGGTFTLNTNYSESDIATIIASLEARITALES